MIHDREIKVSIANNRRSLKWPVHQMTWSAMAEKLKTPTRSVESLGTYLRMSKTEQDELKDVGGFVGGEILGGGRRKAAQVAGRDLVTLDLDNISPMGLEAVLAKVRQLGAAYCVYSTRKHRPEAPRIRLILPSDRTMTAEEYEPVSRKVAEFIGLENCDPTTFEASRMMYWGSCSADSEWVYEVGDHPFMAVDGILNLYKNWRDIRSWPQVPGAQEIQERSLKKQQDPTEKEGIIGAFCREYDIEKAIEVFLPDVYTPDETGPGRYSYAGGSTTGGAVTYDNGKFLYSHHATDPAGGQLCNSFDLVRLHLYGHLDDEAKEGTPVNRQPSYTAMVEQIAKDQNVQASLALERRETALQAFSEVRDVFDPNATVIEKEDLQWVQELTVNKKTGAIEATTPNIYRILLNDPLLKGKIAYDEFSVRVLALGRLPWTDLDGRRDWTDADDSGLRQYLEETWGVTGKDKIDDALTNAAMQRKFNDVTAYLNGLQWDGRVRLETVLIDFFGAEDNEYVRHATRKFFTAGAARAYEPGCKFDYMLILAGPQGCGKSSFLNLLGKQWFSDSLTTFEGKEAQELLQGAWVLEVPELEALSRSETNAAKQFLSKRTDIFRAAYGRRTSKNPRRCIIAGTTNDSEFLKDRTGNRRFWPIELNPKEEPEAIFQRLDEAYVDKLWAEAVHYYRMGEVLYLRGRAAELATEQQSAHLETNPKEGLIRDYLERPIPDNWHELSLSSKMAFFEGNFTTDRPLVERDKVCAAEIWVEVFGGQLRYMQRRDSMEITGILASIDGWHRIRTNARFGEYGTQKGFERTRKASETVNQVEKGPFNLSTNEK